jgi:dTDP-4-dehydrorhamnose reductase
MIIGSGLLAKSLKQADRDDLILFCSGVSNSLETEPAAFERELNLLKEQPKEGLLIYFSTISIFNKAKKNSPYIQHKIAMEGAVQEHFKNHLILRLPNMVGEGGNATNLFPYFLQSIQLDKKVTIFRNTHRHLMSTEELSEIVQILISSQSQGIMDIFYSNPPAVYDLYIHKCRILAATPNYELKDGEDAFHLSNEKFISVLNSAGFQPDSDWRKMVSNYIRLNSSQFA